MNRHPKKILIVEDHRESSMWISMVLRQAGFNTVEASDGTMAIQIARKERPDMVLLDIHLPAGSGYFVLESLRKFEETKSAPVIVMTGDVELDHHEMRELGAAALFKKPMDVQEFLNTIRTVMANYSQTHMALPS